MLRSDKPVLSPHHNQVQLTYHDNRDSHSHDVLLHEVWTKDILPPHVWFNDFFLPGTENLQVFRENGAEKQAFCTVFFFSSGHISLKFLTSKKVGDHTVCSDIVISDLFIGQSKRIITCFFS